MKPEIELPIMSRSALMVISYQQLMLKADMISLLKCFIG